MNGIERILYYANHVEQEAPYDIPEHDPPQDWPTASDVVAEDMVVAYRPLLFNGTMRSNLDPFGLYDDPTLWAALKRACLVQSEKSETSSLDEKQGSDASDGHRKLTLDTEIDAGGTNLSVGQVRAASPMPGSSH